jgi:hypothetical protein
MVSALLSGPTRFPFPQMKASSFPHRAQRWTRVGSREEEGRDDDHSAFQDHEGDLIVG